MNKKINKYDVALILVLIAVNCILMFYNSRNLLYSDENEAFVYSDGELLGQYILKSNYKNEFTVDSEDGYNKIKIEDGKIWVEDSSCNDKYCMHQGKIYSDGQLIVCLPNKLLIKIVGKDKEDVDFISH